MSDNKFVHKLKEGVSVQEVEDFARKYTTEVFLVVAIVVGTISSIFDFFTGPSLTILFLAIGVVLGIFFPTQVEKGLKQFYSFTFKQEKNTQYILGGVKIVIGIFIPFLLFGMTGLVAGTSYHHHMRGSPTTEKEKTSKTRRHTVAEEHD